MIISKLNSIENEIQLKIKELSISNYKPEIIAVSKTFPMKEILPLINHGHIHFGENKAQEALDKWSDIKVDFKDLKLHMIGKIQTNKVKYVVELFDYIHSLDNRKLAEKISNEQQKKNKNLKIFIQVNIENESQKSGITIDRLNEFYKICTQDLNLDIVGTMCIPPKIKNSKNYFSEIYKINTKINLPDLSMGMSGDYLEAAENDSTFLRIGSKIFGERN